MRNLVAATAAIIAAGIIWCASWALGVGIWYVAGMTAGDSGEPVSPATNVLTYGVFIGGPVLAILVAVGIWRVGHSR